MHKISLTYRQNLPNSSFLEKNLLHRMRMKHFSKLDCFWNLKFNKLEFQPIPFSMKSEIDPKKKKSGTRVLETRVPLTKIFPPHAFLLIFFQKYAFLQIFPSLIYWVDPANVDLSFLYERSVVISNHYKKKKIVILLLKPWISL